MGAKAVYNNQSIMIYVTGEHSRALLQNGSLILECYIGTQLISSAGCYVELAPEIVTEFDKVRQAEVSAIQVIKDQLHAAHPETSGARNRRRLERRKRAKRTIGPDVPD